MSSLITCSNVHGISPSCLIQVVLVIRSSVLNSLYVYCALVEPNFQTVEIDIRDDTGVKIPFERGRVVVTLHCRKRKESYLE
jgi:hypothetical protein